ncbi:MAG TPA: hypothetical protein VNN76_01310 [Bacteroidota bacterium]|nr:hypothetical protein [Bacteroidota bacterium]
MQKLFSIWFVPALLVFLVSCEKSSEPSTTGDLSLSSAYSKAAPPATMVNTLSKSHGAMAVDSITISRARLVLRDIKFKSSVDSLTFKSEPMVLELSLTGAAQSIGVINVRFGTFNRIEFDVHRIEASEITSLPASEQAKFNDFLVDQRYSIIINGTVYSTGAAPQSFTYRSKIDAKQKIDLVPELVLSEANPVANATMLVSSANWFRSSAGALVDPNDPNNEGIIDENLKASIRVFKDNNRDGSKD